MKIKNHRLILIIKFLFKSIISRFWIIISIYSFLALKPNFSLANYFPIVNVLFWQKSGLLNPGSTVSFLKEWQTLLTNPAKWFAILICTELFCIWDNHAWKQYIIINITRKNEKKTNIVLESNNTVTTSCDDFIIQF